MASIYETMDRKRKQLMLLEYPYKSDRQLWDSTMNAGGIDSNKVFNSLQDIEEFKEQAAQDDISLTKRRDFVVGDKRTANSQTISSLDSTMSAFGDEAYRNAMEMSKKEFSPEQAIKELYIIQAQRLLLGVQYEQDVGLGNNPETEACRQGLESIIKTANDIINGKKIDIHAEYHHSLTDAIMDMEIDDDDLIDVEGGIDEYDYS